MEAKKLFNDMLSWIITPSLKKAGFTKAKQSFYYLYEGNWGIIDFQKSTKTDPSTVVFTVNAGIVSNRILNFLAQIEPNKKPDIWDAHWRVRIGYLMPSNTDLWWTIEDGTNITNLGQTILDNIINFGVPEIRKFIKDESLRDLWLSGKSPALTDFQRLMYLCVLLKQIGPSEILGATIIKLIQISENKQSSITAELFINKLRNL